VAVHDRLGDREAETGSLNRGVRRGLRAEELVEELLLVGLADADPGVADLDPRLVAQGADGELDAATLWRELDRIRHEVVQQLAEPAGVTTDEQLRTGLVAEVHARVSSDGKCRSHRLLGEDAEFDRIVLDGELPRLDLRDEEQIVDEREETIGVAADDLREVALVVGERALEQQLEIAADRCERGAQLVRHQGDELVLEPVQLTEALVRDLLLREHAFPCGFSAVPLRHVACVEHDALHVLVVTEIGDVRLEVVQVAGGSR
jgi:hypothetical protein